VVLKILIILVVIFLEESGNQEKEWSLLPFGILTAKPYLTAACFESKDNGKQAQGVTQVYYNDGEM